MIVRIHDSMQSWLYALMIACLLALMAAYTHTVTSSARGSVHIRQCSLFTKGRMHAWLYALTISCTHDCMHSWLHVQEVHMTVFVHECMHPWLHAPWLMHACTAYAHDSVQPRMHVAMTTCTLYCIGNMNACTHSACTHDCMTAWSQE